MNRVDVEKVRRELESFQVEGFEISNTLLEVLQRGMRKRKRLTEKHNK